MRSRPVVLYLNQEYWVIYFLQEKFDATYFSEKYHLRPPAGALNGDMVVQALLVTVYTFTGNSLSNRSRLALTFTFIKPLTQITKILDKYCSQIKFVRSNQSKQSTMMFLIKPKSVAALETLRQELKKLDSRLETTLLQYQPLV